MHRSRLLALTALLCLACFGSPALAQPSPLARAAASTNPPPAEEPSVTEPPPGSPRAALQKYLELGHKGRFAEASTLLEVPKAREAERPLLAKRLLAVLDRYVWIDLEKVSDVDDGALNDGLPAKLEQIATIPVEGKTSEPVRMIRHGAGWRFSPSTVDKVDEWYEALPDRWLLDNLPAPLLRVGPRSLLWWQWLGLGLAALVGAIWGALLGAVARKWLGRAAAKTPTEWDDRIVARSRGPLALAFALGTLRALLPLLLLYEPAEVFVHRALRGLFLANLLWAVWRFVDVVAELSWDSAWSHDHAGSRALIPLARRAGKALVAVAALVLLLSALGYPVTSLIAGLGIGGLAVALASQKTVENLFGAFSLGIDQPFREGDFVRIEDLTGTVERLGLRSTRIRTPDRTLVSIPNGKLAEMRLETFAVRDRMRLACNLGLVYGTSAAQLKAVLAGVEETLRKHPKLWPDGVSVRLVELASSSLNIEVSCWFDTPSFDEFTVIRQDMLLAFLQVVEDAGTALAFPTQTVQLQQLPR
ncbi:MAG TPA: mechanosensitive ion channel family protein [Polyangiaceae bacterium]|nr:mechanosensitive ion channel family protein [Polyangiaceae bacterium]